MDDAASDHSTSTLRSGKLAPAPAAEPTPETRVPQRPAFVNPGRVPQSLKHFNSNRAHAICVVQKESVRTITLLPGKSTDTRVAVITPNSVMILDVTGPMKRLIKLQAISELYVQEQQTKQWGTVRSLLIKIPTEHDLLLLLVNDPRNDVQVDFVKVLQQAWVYERYERKSVAGTLMTTHLDPQEKITKHAQLVDVTGGIAAKTKCKECASHKAAIEGLQEKLVDVACANEVLQEQVSHTSDLAKKLQQAKKLTAEANAGRMIYRDKCKELMDTVDRQKEELETWKEFCEVLVKQQQVHNTAEADREGFRNLCHPYHVAQVEARNERLGIYKDQYDIMKQRLDELEGTRYPDGSVSSTEEDDEDETFDASVMTL
eukprot:TRINITY_DN19102_c0_g1_i1.p1 TRINITY_DN19102_c0_g1~~TRINITY_DN19102_c0_g1_i1.p1  ORF type:complete len:374 (+),score=131.35 TRINITY_DN19102_c0_g1_i1:130-1251(+)